MSVGIEDVEDIIADLEQALKAEVAPTTNKRKERRDG